MEGQAADMKWVKGHLPLAALCVWAGAFCLYFAWLLVAWTIDHPCYTQAQKGGREVNVYIGRY